MTDGSTTEIDPWPCDECGSDMRVEKTGELGPVTSYTAECGVCGHKVIVSVTRVVDRDEADVEW